MTCAKLPGKGKTSGAKLLACWTVSYWVLSNATHQKALLWGSPNQGPTLKERVTRFLAIGSAKESFAVWGGSDNQRKQLATAGDPHQQKS